MTIRAKWLGQSCTVQAVTTFDSTPIFLVAALPGEAFFDGKTMFSAYRPELTDVETDNPAYQAAMEAYQNAIANTDTLADERRPETAAALTVENMARAVLVASIL